MSARSDSSRICCFCNSSEDNELEYGKFYEHNGIITHYYCLLLSSNMEQKGNDNEGILGFLTDDIQKELRRGKRLVCSYCKKHGATLGCCNARCKRIFHFPCGLKAGSLHQFFGEFRSYCVTHRPKQKIDDNLINQAGTLDNILCYICYDKVNPIDTLQTLWAPCCKKDAWFHRKCVQQLALSAGYFFKCPLCNNKKDFQKAMLEFGIFVPSQDASWELVPNAFEELLYRHNQCDAKDCLCPKGRNHISSNAKWELVLCRTCGSQGMHMACGKLKWANPVWECEECISITLGNNKRSETTQEANNDSDSSSFLSTDSDLDSDSDISVGTEFPILPCASPIFSFSSPNASQDSTPNVTVRPGPLSFKLRQQKDTVKRELKTTCKKNVDIKPVLKDSNTSYARNRDKEESEKTQPTHSTRNITDVITIESDEDEIECLSLKQQTKRTELPNSLQQLSVTSSLPSAIPITKLLSPTENSVNSNNLNVASYSMATDDDSQKLTSFKEVLDKSEFTAVEQFKVTTPLEFVSDSVFPNNNDLKDINDATDISEKSVMNIKITNVTSLPPEVFESVPDVSENRWREANSLTHSLVNQTENFFTGLMPIKRSLQREVTDDTNNYNKRIKQNGSNENTWARTKALGEERKNLDLHHPTSFVIENHKDWTLPVWRASPGVNPLVRSSVSQTIQTIQTTVACNTDEQPQSGRTSSNRFTEIGENIGNCLERSPKTYASGINDILTNNQNIGLSTVSTPMLYERLVESGPIESNCSRTNNKLLRTNWYFNTSQRDKNSTRMEGCSDNTKRVVYFTPKLQNTKTISTSANANQITEALNERRTSSANIVTLEKTADNVSCDGDASSKPAKTDSIKWSKNDQSKESPSDAVDTSSNRSSAAMEGHSVFPQVTNNLTTCHQPRLIPQYMYLDDLKFRVCESNNVQMILYDTFSVNIPAENHKESKIRLTALAPSREPRRLHTLVTSAQDEASSSSDYINDYMSTEQRDKFFRFLINENHLISDKLIHIMPGHDDAKENLDPGISKTLSRNVNKYNNVNLANNVDDIAHVRNVRSDNDDDVHLSPSNTNLNTLSRTICNIDNITDNGELASNDRTQESWINLENIQHKQASAYSTIPLYTPEEKISGARPSHEATNKIIHDFGFFVNTNKNIEKVSQDNISVFMNQHSNVDREIDSNRNWHTFDYSKSWNGCKTLDIANIMALKAEHRNVASVSNIMFNERNILNKQIDTCDSGKFIHCMRFCDNTVDNISNSQNCNSNKHCLKVSIDLCKIRNLIDSKPELFTRHKRNSDQRRKCSMNRSHGQTDFVQQVRL